MTYDLYFHDDFDGRASGAVMLSFLRSRGDDIAHYVPVQYDILPQWSKLDFFEQNKLFRGKHYPAIVVDFTYHPKATWWFDHHATAFRNEKWRKKFRPSKFHHLDAAYKSACHLVEASLKKDFNWKPPKHFKELVSWLDIYDGANYKNAEQTFDLENPGLALGAFVDYEGRKKTYMTDAWLIREIAEKPFSEILALPDIKKILELIEKRVVVGKKYYREKLKVFGDIGLIDLGSHRFAELRFFPFYLHSELKYTMRLRREKKGHYHFSMGVNPWNRDRRAVHVGNLLRGRFPGGGGHRGVGGAEFKTRKEAIAAAEKVINVLQKK